jgi:hypothetical protein
VAFAPHRGVRPVKASAVGAARYRLGFRPDNEIERREADLGGYGEDGRTGIPDCYRFALAGRFRNCP